LLFWAQNCCTAPTSQKNRPFGSFMIWKRPPGAPSPYGFTWNSIVSPTLIVFLVIPRRVRWFTLVYSMFQRTGGPPLWGTST
jgi:hypothetical protein